MNGNKLSLWTKITWVFNQEKFIKEFVSETEESYWEKWRGSQKGQRALSVMETKCSYRQKQTAAVTLTTVICYWDQRDCQESSRGHEHRVQSGLKDHMRLSSAPLMELLWFLHSCSGADGLCHLLVLILQRDGVWPDGTAAHTHWRKEISGLYVIIICLVWGLLSIISLWLLTQSTVWLNNNQPAVQ